MLYDEELKGRMIEALDGSEVWVVKSAEDTTDTVYLHHWDVEDGQETFETFSPVEAMGLAIELARCSGVSEACLGSLERRLTWMQTDQLAAEFSGEEMVELDKLSLELFDGPGSFPGMGGGAVSIRVGTRLYGYCGGFFGRDDYNDKRVEALGEDWVVVRYEWTDELGFCSFVGGDWSLKDLEEYTVKRTEDEY